MPKHKSDVWDYYRQNNDISICNFCDATFKVNATRMKKHLTRDCTKCPPPVKVQFFDEVAVSSFRLKQDSDAQRGQNAGVETKTSSMPCSSNPFSNSTNTCSTVATECFNAVAVKDGNTSSDRKVQSTLFKFSDSMSSNESNQVDLLFAKAVYCSAAPLSMFANPHWEQFFRRLRPAWNPPSAFKLSNSLLSEWTVKVSEENAIKFSSAPVLAMLSDGWSCVSGDSHIQFLMSTPKPVFLKSVHPKTASHTADYIFGEVSNIIDSANELFNRPPTDILAFCSDNAANMKAAWAMISHKYPWMYCYGCTAHTLNLLAGDIHRIGVVDEILHDNRQISKFFRDHQIAKAVLEEKCIEKYGKSLRCILGVATRWSSDYAMVHRNINIKAALMLSALDSRNTQLFNLNKTVKTNILDDDGFWLKSQYVSDLLLPIKNAIQEVEGDLVPISVVPRVWQVLQYRVKAKADEMCQKSFITHQETDNIMSFVHKRIQMNRLAVHCAASLLDPRFSEIELGMSDADVAAAENIILTIAHNKGIQQVDILNDLAQYRARQDPYCAVNRAHIWEHASLLETNPCMWWSSYASGRPLCKVATILLSLPCSTAAVERGNKAYSLQKTKKRNRLSDDLSATLTSVAYNLVSNMNHMINEPGAAKLQRIKHTALIMPSAENNASNGNSRLVGWLAVCLLNGIIGM